MLPKIVRALFFLSAALLVFIIVSPLDYTTLLLPWVHFWITVVLGIAVLFLYAKTAASRKFPIVLSSVSVPVFGVVCWFSLFTHTGGGTDSTPIPGSDKVILSRFYTLFMMGNPRMEIAVGHVVFPDVLVWRSGTNYLKNGMGDSPDEIRRYVLPDSLYDREFVFLLPEEGYAFDGVNVFKLELKQQPKSR